MLRVPCSPFLFLSLFFNYSGRKGEREGGREGEAAAWRSLTRRELRRSIPPSIPASPPDSPRRFRLAREISLGRSPAGYLQRRPYCSPSFRHVLLPRAGASAPAAPPGQGGFLIFHLVIPYLVRVTPPGAASFNKAPADVATADARYAVKPFKPEFIYATALSRAARAARNAGASYLVSPFLHLSLFLFVISRRDSRASRYRQPPTSRGK